MSVANKIGKYAYVPSHINYFKAKGQYFARGAKTPQRGDVIFFGSGGSHVGLVDYVSGGYVHTIEGNTSGASGLIANGGGVCAKTYSLTTSYILGYGRPDYAAGEAEKIIAIAKAEIGYLEKASNSQLDSKTANAGRNNYTKYARDIWPSLQAQPWCDIFVSWCAIEADKTTSTTTTTTTTTTTEEAFPVAKTYRNGSTPEPVYADTLLSLKTGSLNRYETCECLGIVNGRYLVKYKVDGSTAYKTGFVEYSGGVKA